MQTISDDDLGEEWEYVVFCKAHQSIICGYKDCFNAFVKASEILKSQNMNYGSAEYKEAKSNVRKLVEKRLELEKEFAWT